MKLVCGTEPVGYNGKKYLPGEEMPFDQLLIDKGLAHVVEDEPQAEPEAEQPAAEAAVDPIDDSIGEPMSLRAPEPVNAPAKEKHAKPKGK